jgi:hypothetical protein
MKYKLALFLGLFSQFLFAAGTSQRVTVNTPLTISGGRITLPQADTDSSGYLSFGDWNTFSAKQNALTLGNIAGSGAISVTGGTSAIIGSGVSVSCASASGSQVGCLSSADWSTFDTAATTTAAATSSNTNGTIVKRDGSGNFTATTVTASLSGNASTATALASNPTDCGAGEFASAISASGNLTCSNPFTGMVEVTPGHIATPSAKVYHLQNYAEYAFTVNRITSECDSGTADFDLEINGTNVTGCSSQQMANAEAVDTCTAANTVAVGDSLTLNVTGVSSPDDCRFTIKTTRN